MKKIDGVDIDTFEELSSDRDIAFGKDKRNFYLNATSLFHQHFYKQVLSKYCIQKITSNIYCYTPDAKEFLVGKAEGELEKLFKDAEIYKDDKKVYNFHSLSNGSNEDYVKTFIISENPDTFDANAYKDRQLALYEKTISSNKQKVLAFLIFITIFNFFFFLISYFICDNYEE